jgi:hypothetical protein
MKDDQITLSFPLGGIDNSAGFERIKPRKTPRGETVDSAQDAANVRGYDPLLDRMRGGSRSGLTKFVPARIVPAVPWVVQGLNTLATVEDSQVQYNQSGRVVYVLAVNQGNVYYAFPGDQTWTAATNNSSGTPPLSIAGIVRSASNGQKQWFADGVNRRFFTPVTNSVEDWEATAGLLPVDDDGNYPRLICTWRGRIVEAGLLGDPQNWFMSAVGDPTDWDYSPASTTPTQAIAGAVGNIGLTGDVITGLIPYTDDTLIFGCDHSIRILRGDPMNGGFLDLVTEAIGVAWGEAWAIDPEGSVWFVSNRNAVYTMVPGQQPVRRSFPIDGELRNLDPGQTVFRLIWDDTTQGMHLFCTPLLGPLPATHYFWEARTGAWWKDRYADDLYNPAACCTIDGNNPGDRVAVIGSWDGYVRAIDRTATKDDRKRIESYVLIGPILTPDMDEVMLHEIQGLLGEQSEDVTFEVYVGRSSEAAISSAPVFSGTWKAGRNLTHGVRRSGHAVYFKIASSNPWQSEQIRLRVESLGAVRRRGR